MPRPPPPPARSSKNGGGGARSSNNNDAGGIGGDNQKQRERYGSYSYCYSELLRVVATDDALRQCEERLISSSSSNSQQQQYSSRCYDVPTWTAYLDAIEERIDELAAAATTTTATAGTGTAAADSSRSSISQLRRLREWTGRRALALLPRSYKLWKRQLDFLTDWWEKRPSRRRSTTSTGTASASASADDDGTAAAAASIDDEDSAYLRKIVPRAFERSLWTLHSMPRVWIMYFEWIVRASSSSSSSSSAAAAAAAAADSSSPPSFRGGAGNNKSSSSTPPVLGSTRIRRLINKALQALPVTQHQDKLWPAVLDVAELLPLESRTRIMKRYATIARPAYKKEYAQFLLDHGLWGRAAAVYRDVLNDAAVQGLEPDEEIWSLFLNVCSQHPEDVAAEGSVPWEKIVRSALESASATTATTDSSKPSAIAAAATGNKASSSLQGYLWSQMADAWIRRGQFDMARSVYEEGMQKVTTVRDFVILYQAYMQLEEGLLQQIAEEAEEEEEEGEEGDGGGGDADVAVADGDDWDILLSSGTPDESQPATSFGGSKSSSKLVQMEFALAKAEHLTSRRPLWLSAVRLRQNPNDVGEWIQRADLFLNDTTSSTSAGGDASSTTTVQQQQAASVLEQALKTVNCYKAVNGVVSDLVTKLVQVYEAANDTANARELLDRVCNRFEVQFSKPDQLSECWVAWIELELRHERWDDALSLARQSVAPPGRGGSQAAPAAKPFNLSRSLRLWDLLLDLEESLGTVQTTKDAYNRAIEIKAATVQHVLNFATFLTEHKYFEESFAAYEKGLTLFAQFPAAKLLWTEYIQAFLNRYKGTKVERARDLFERCQQACPSEDCAEFFIMNGAFEEEHGLVKRALSVYQQMCDKVPKAEKLTAYKLWIAKTTKYLGKTATRDIYQQALDQLDDAAAATLCIDFSKLETSLQEIDRARGILVYGAQMADPRRLPDYWKHWNEFEIAHGNEETFREMLRVKRSVEAAFSTVNYNAAGMDEKQEKLTEEEAMKMIASQEGVSVQQQAKSNIAGFVASRDTSSSKRTATAANLDDVEERVAKLRKATAASSGAHEGEGGAEDNDDDEIDIDDIDAEIEEAAAEGAAASEEEDADEETTEDKVVGGADNIKTKTVPAAVFGGLASSTATGSGALDRLRKAGK